MINVLDMKIKLLYDIYLRKEVTHEQKQNEKVYDGPEFPQHGEELKCVKHVLKECLNMMIHVHPMNQFDPKYEKIGKILDLEGIK